MIEKCHLRPTINVTEISQIKEITIKMNSQETTILQIKAVNSPNFQNQSNYGIRYHSNYSKNGYPRHNQQPSYNSNPRQNESYDEKYPKQNTFRDNEQAAKQRYDQENRQSSSDPRGRQYNQNGYNRTNSRDSDRSRSPGFRMNQNQVENTHWVEEETYYCNALTDMFPLNY